MQLNRDYQTMVDCLGDDKRRVSADVRQFSMEVIIRTYVSSEGFFTQIPLPLSTENSANVSSSTASDTMYENLSILYFYSGAMSRHVWKKNTRLSTKSLAQIN